MHQEKQASLVATLLRVMLGIWVPFSWAANRPDLVNASAAQSAVDVDLALAQVRRWARAEVIEQLRALDALPEKLPDLQDLYPRSGTPIVEVYKRPARQAEHALRQGATPEQAEAVLVERMTKIVEMDAVATIRDEKSIIHQAAPKVTGYRRILRPDLTKYGPCGLCIVAADRTYHTGDLLELHNGCVCDTAAITADADPGLSLNREDLDAIYEAAGGNFAEALQRTRVVVRENGELGPILVRDGNEFKTFDKAERQSKRGQSFTPYRRPSKTSNRTNWSAMRATSEKAILTLEDARREGRDLVSMTASSTPTKVADFDKAIGYHRALIARAQAHGA
ncbi:hypothetical protein RS82_04130 [Microbacterium trichothecenolyticum]|uniref:Uncharacterized protein n=1 Tax=Microbacterium trichothecenolyticum TaxID=69370 RepID=A0A0M2H138_MICTR|nr:hypothetical protein RS82_04130 [Microbacterium trichothecenolyticum]